MCTMLHSLHSSNSDIAGDTATVTVPTKVTQDKTNGDPISDHEIRKEEKNNQTNEPTKLWDQWKGDERRNQRKGVHFTHHSPSGLFRRGGETHRSHDRSQLRWNSHQMRSKETAKWSPLYHRSTEASFVSLEILAVEKLGCTNRRKQG